MEKDPVDTLSASSPFRCAGLSHIGNVRQENEDTFIMDPELGLFVVSDGMGGHRAGLESGRPVAGVYQYLQVVRISRAKTPGQGRRYLGDPS